MYVGKKSRWVEERRVDGKKRLSFGGAKTVFQCHCVNSALYKWQFTFEEKNSERKYQENAGTVALNTVPITTDDITYITSYI